MTPPAGNCIADGYLPSVRDWCLVVVRHGAPLRRRVTPKGGGANADLLMRTQLIVQLPKRLQLRLQRLTARAPAAVRR